MAELDTQLEILDWELGRFDCFEETRAELEQLGSMYRTPGRASTTARAATNHICPADDIEALIVAAQESPLDRAYREYRATMANVVWASLQGCPLKEWARLAAVAFPA